MGQAFERTQALEHIQQRRVVLGAPGGVGHRKLDVHTKSPRTFIAPAFSKVDEQARELRVDVHGMRGSVERKLSLCCSAQLFCWDRVLNSLCHPCCWNAGQVRSVPGVLALTARRRRCLHGIREEGTCTIMSLWEFTWTRRYVGWTCGWTSNIMYGIHGDRTLQDAPCSAMAGTKRKSPLASLATVCRLRWRWSSPCGSSQQSAYHARNGGSNGSNSHRHCSRRGCLLHNHMHMHS